MEKQFINIPDKMKKYLDNVYDIDEIGCSKSNILLFEEQVLKIENQNEESDNELLMLKWLEDKLPVPKLIDFERVNNVNYILMSRLKGKMGIDEIYLNNPEKLIKLLVKALKLLWSLDIKNCPYTNNLDNKLKLAKYRIKENLIDINDFEEETYNKFGKSINDIYNYMIINRPLEDLVFSHGDFCLPNIIFSNNDIAGFIDLGRSGVADRYQDIALCYRSLKHNLNSNFYANKFLEEINIDIDFDKIEYYILLDELF